MDKKEGLYCPQCGSAHVEWFLPHDWSRWHCLDCGYIGALILEDGVIAEHLRKERKTP